MEPPGQKKTLTQRNLYIIFIHMIIFVIIWTTIVSKLTWEDRIGDRKQEMLAISLELHSVINNEMDNIQLIRVGEDSINAKVAQLKAYIQPNLEIIANNYPEYSLGYYDQSLHTIVALVSESGFAIADQIPQSPSFFEIFSTDKPTFHVSDTFPTEDKAAVLTVAHPIFDGYVHVGYIWVNAKTSDIINEVLKQAAFFSLLASLSWLLVLLLFRKFSSNVIDTIQQFATAIEQEEADIHPVKELPELNPILQKIEQYSLNLKTANRQYQETRNNLGLIMDSITDAFIAVDSEWTITYLNREARALFFPSQSFPEGLKMLEAFPYLQEMNTYQKLYETMEQKQAQHWEEYVPYRDKHSAYSAFPYADGISVFIRDISEKKRQEKEMLRLEKLNLIGQMAAGISHEVRNPLTVVKGFLQMLQQRNQSHLDQQYMKLMVEEIDRAIDIMKDFLGLSKISVEKFEPTDLNQLILRLYPMLQADARNMDKHLELELQDIPFLPLSPSEIIQLILNQVRNALEASALDGVVRIRTFMEQGIVTLAIEDLGEGLPAVIIEGMGTPFLTTKEYGTGLGLPISIEIARRHDAIFDFQTSEKGTTFYIRFADKKQLA